MSPEYILSTLNGVMASQAEGLTQDEKIKLAEYITGGKVSKTFQNQISVKKYWNCKVKKRRWFLSMGL